MFATCKRIIIAKSYGKIPSITIFIGVRKKFLYYFKKERGALRSPHRLLFFQIFFHGLFPVETIADIFEVVNHPLAVFQNEREPYLSDVAAIV